MGTNQQSETRTERVNVRVDPATKRKLARRAAKAKRTPSDYVRLLIERDLRRVA